MDIKAAVVGGGIAGLSAAHRLVERGAHVVLVEQSGVLGGKLRTGTLAGHRVETGAETFLTGAPGGGPSAAVALARGLGLDLVHPAQVPAAVAVGGALHRLPPGNLLGVPADPSTLDAWVRATPGLDVDTGTPLLRPGEDTAVGPLVRRRLGDGVVDLLVDPLLGGVYAGRADTISLRMAIPALARAAETESTLAGAAKAALAQRRSVPGEPVFAAPVGGMGALVGALAGALTAAGAEIRLGLPARSLARHGSGWRVVVGSTRDPSHVDVDVVVLAVPGTPAARLLSTVDIEFVPPEYASVALVALVLPDATALPELSGFLVPATEGYAVKAATFFARKWPGSPPVVRASLGRAGDEATLQRTDADLVELVRGELRDLIGALPTPTASAVYRWGGALPQYQKGHLDRVEALRARLGRGLALAGAAVAGVGIPACVESGKTAADRVLDDLEE